jgi:hypothetical protein
MGANVSYGFYVGLVQEDRAMINRLSPRTRVGVKGVLRRLDRIAGDLNVLLVVIAVGLATLDLTLLITQKIAEHLPPVTRAAHAQSPGPQN